MNISRKFCKYLSITAIILSVLCSDIFNAFAANHKCSDHDHCPICLVIKAAEQAHQSSNIAAIIVVVIAAISVPAKIAFCAQNVRISNPVSLKTRINS